MNFPRRIVRKGSPEPAVEELWDEDRVPNLSMNDHKHEERAVTKSTLSQRLANIFSKSNRETLNQVSEAIRGLDDSQLDGFHNRHTMPSRSDINAGTPLPASGDGAFIAQEIYGEDDQEHNMSAEYSEFSKLLTHVSEQLKSVQAGQAALASVFHRLLKADEIDEDEPDEEELEKALQALREGGAVPDSLHMPSASVQQVLERIMGKSKHSSTPPNFRKAGAVPREVAIRHEIEKLCDDNDLDQGQGIQALDILNRVQACKEGVLVKSAVTESLQRAHPSVRGLFERHGIRLPQQAGWVEGI